MNKDILVMGILAIIISVISLICLNHSGVLDGSASFAETLVLVPGDSEHKAITCTRSNALSNADGGCTERFIPWIRQDGKVDGYYDPTCSKIRPRMEHLPCDR